MSAAHRPECCLVTQQLVAVHSYRFRLISLSCDPFYTFSIDGHNMTIIEADAVNTQPHTVDSIDILAGQRYSFIVSPLP